MAERLCESASCEALSRSSGATCLTRAFKVSSSSFLSQIVYALTAALRAKLFMLSRPHCLQLARIFLPCALARAPTAALLAAIVHLLAMRAFRMCASRTLLGQTATLITGDRPVLFVPTPGTPMASVLDAVFFYGIRVIWAHGYGSVVRRFDSCS